MKFVIVSQCGAAKTKAYELTAQVVLASLSVALTGGQRAAK
jgi:hypothetical protein